MQLAIGDVLEGKVTGITKFGAFVELEPGKTGMVHISEVSTDYVEDISQYLKKDQTVKVKVINITEEGKISLSIKKAMPREPRPEQHNAGGKGVPKTLETDVMTTAANVPSIHSRSAAMSGIRAKMRAHLLRICSTNLNRPAMTRCLI